MTVKSNIVTLATIASEVQTVTVDATGGTFTITFPASGLAHSGGTTAALAFDVSAEDATTACEAVVGADNIVVTGGPGDSGGTQPYTLTYAGDLAYTNVSQVTTTATSLTGGAGTATPATTTAGVARVRLDTAAHTDGKDGSCVYLRNTGAQTAYIGGPDVTTSNGYPLAATTTMQWELDLADGEALYGCTSTSTTTVAVLETGA